VNDEVPYFETRSRSETIPENLSVGSPVVTITAVDTDSNPRLRYEILQDSILATDEEGRDVNVTANNIQVNKMLLRAEKLVTDTEGDVLCHG
jgi:hypothetical protein